MVDIEKYPWTEWEPFPNPFSDSFDNLKQFGSLRLRLRDIVLKKPKSPGVYQLRNKKTKEFVLFGEGAILFERMCSLLPHEAGGRGNRNNFKKREYVKKNLNEIEFRILHTKTKKEAKKIDNILKSLKIHIFNT